MAADMQVNSSENTHWVFVHGATGSGDFWEFVRPHFPGAWMVDLPGHEEGRVRRPGGTSSPVSAPLGSIDEYADWLSAQIAERGWREVIVVGHSMGGAIAQVVGLRRPPWLRGLVLSGTGARLRVAPALLELLAADYPAAIDWLIDHSFATPLNRYRREGMRRALLRIPQAVSLADYAACNTFDVTAALREGALSGPAVIVCGQDDVMTPPRYSEFLAAHIQRSAEGVVEGAGHMAPLEQPAAWSATVRRLWAALATASPPGS